jgi:DeoR/GlpR family transcriptional regulator of sugar metabolism
MKKAEKIEKLQELEKLINAGKTGTPDELAQLLNVQNRTARRLVAELKKKHPSIRYNRIWNTYQQD